MFFKKKPDPLKPVVAALKTKDLERIGRAIEGVVVEFGLESEVSHKLMALIQDHRLPFLNLLRAYVDANPGMVTSAQVHLATRLAEDNRLDEASAEARNVLRRLLASPAISSGTAEVGMRSLAARAYLITTAVYTGAGARSYALRVLARAVALDPEPAARRFIENEMDSLRRELREPANADRDEMWEAFFTRFERADDLVAHCMSLGFEDLARRVELLRDRFRFDARFAITPDETVLEVYRAEIGDAKQVAYVLR